MCLLLHVEAPLHVSPKKKKTSVFRKKNFVVNLMSFILSLQVIDYEVPLIVMASFALSAAIIIPIVGLIFCCCRCGGKCGGNIDDRKLKLHPTKERIAYSVGILLCAFFLM